MFETERNQPMRTCASADGFSRRILGTLKGVLVSPMPSSNGSSFLAPAAKIDPMVGAAERWSQATGMPLSSRPASRRSTEMVW
jgi:hypothetical protein